MSDKLKFTQPLLGESYRASNKYFHDRHYIDDDTIVINTNNVITVKGNYVLVIDKNQAVYLKDWNVREVRNWDMGWQGHAVKLQRKYFKPYTFRKNFDDYAFDKPDTFEGLVRVAKEQTC
ncbi:MAG: hypothetical protein ACOYH4_04250 [Saccharofermentanales bacterium]|jgi:hypothetical protein